MAKLKINEIRSKYGSKIGTSLLEQDHKFWLPSRNLALNWQMGGGIPYGTILEEFGWESTGKSLLAADFGVVTQSLGGQVLWADAEFAFEDSKEYYRSLGLDPDLVEVAEEDAMEIISDWTMDMVKHYRSVLVNNEPILLVVDTIAALDSLEEQVSYASDPKKNKQMGKRPKAIYEFYRNRRKLLKQLGITVIMINQVRDKVGASMFEESTTTPGGRATAFYASIRLALFKGSQIKDGDMKVGQKIHLHIKKNKTAPARGKIQTEVHFLDNIQGYIGYSRYAGLDAVLKTCKLLNKKDGTYTIGGKGDLGKNQSGIIQAIADSKENRKLIISALKINTVSKLRKKLESQTKNHFPIADKKK